MAALFQELQIAKEKPGYENRVGDMYLRYQRAKDFHQRRFDRCLTNWRYYLGQDSEFGLGQHALKMIAYLKSQGRDIATYNISKGYVDLVAGGIMQSPFDPEFFPVNEEVSSITDAAKNAMYSDKELLDWGTSYFELVRAGLVYQGVMKMVISDKYHKLGNIGFENVLPLHWFGDPMWVTVHTRDCRLCWEEVVLQPEHALEVYGNHMKMTNDGMDLEALLNTYLGRVAEYGVPNGPTPFAASGSVTSDFSWGSALRFINEYRMVRNKVTTAVYHSPDGDVVIPNELPDPRAKIEWLNSRYGEGWDPYAIEEVEDYVNICMKETICPSLTWCGVISEAPCEVQIDQIPFFVWSADRVNGEPHGLIDLVRSIQDDVNSTNATINNKLQTEGGGGGQFVDPAGFETPEECDDYIAHRNDPTKTWKTAPGMMVRNGSIPAKPVVQSNFPAEVYKRLDHILSVMMPHVSKVIPATRGQTEQSNESGYLLSLKKIQSDQALYTIHYMLRQFWNQVYEGYLLQAGSQYAIESVERKFATSNGEKSSVFNERVNLPNGAVGMRNDASMLKTIRHKVIISDIQQTPTKRIEDLGIIKDYLSSMGNAMQVKPLTVNYMITRMAELIDPLSKEEKETIRELGMEEIEAERLALMVRTRKAALELRDLELQLSTPPAPPLQMDQNGQPIPPAPAAPAAQPQGQQPGAFLQPPVPQAPQGA